MTDVAETRPASERVFGCLRFLALVFGLLGALGFAGYHAAIPYTVTVTIADLTRESDDLLVGDFALPWPLKINKNALDDVSVVLPNGVELEQYATRAALSGDESHAMGFFVDRPMIAFRLDERVQALPDGTLSVSLPARTRDVVYILPFWLAALLFLVSWLSPGVAASLKPLRPRPLAISAGALLVGLGGLLGMVFAKGSAFWLAFLALLVGPLIAAAVLLQVEAEARRRPSQIREPMIKLALLLGTVLGSCLVFEAYLTWVGAAVEPREHSTETADEDWFLLPDEVVRLANARADFLTLPDAWRRQDKTIEGASSAYLWHDALHIRDKQGFRRLDEPFPAKDDKTLRIMVVGDSLTYGVGIAEDWTYSRLLERSLQADHRAEVFNLGRSGYQSEHILGVLYKFLPEINPDLVIYAVCLNDFLPAGQSQYSRYSFPLPEEWKKYFSQRTQLARLFDDAYQSLLIALDIRDDFFDDILAGEDGFQARFARDVAAMNRLVKERGLPPTIGIVFHQLPGGDPRAWGLIEIAEGALANAGFDLISVLSWRERFKDQVFPVSRWEGHPNELAHSLIAEHLDERLRGNDRLVGYRIGD